MTADAVCSKVLSKTDTDVLEGVQLALEFTETILENLQRDFALAFFSCALDVIDVLRHESNQRQLTVTSNMLTHNLHIRLTRKVEQVVSTSENTKFQRRGASFKPKPSRNISSTSVPVSKSS